MNEIKLSELLIEGINQGKIPRHFYKYRALDSFFDRILMNDELWFSKPEDFNDPFDCQITIDTTNTQFEIERFLRVAAPPDTPNDQIKAMAKSLFYDNKTWNDVNQRNLKSTLNSSGICCFGGNETNILLWSHYTDSHKGVCLKFDALADPDFFVSPFIVNYSTEYPIYNIRDQEELIEKMLKTKSSVWAYEEEIRVVKLEHGLHQFKKAGLVEIIFGCKSKTTEIDRIKKLALNNKYDHLVFRQAVLKEKHYGIDFIIV